MSGLTYHTQANPTATELVVLSQPNDAGYSLDDYRNYIWKGAWLDCSHSFIYHAELGINKAHKDFQDRTIEWLYTGLTKNMKYDVEEEVIYKGGHSTCTASEAAGTIYGASKPARLVVVKMMPDLNEGSIGVVLPTILRDVIGEKRQGRSVVGISWVSTATAVSFGRAPDPGHTFGVDMIKLSAWRVVVVCAAGNEGEELDSRGQL